MAAVGDKYIIEIGEVYESKTVADNMEQFHAPSKLYRVKGFNSLVFDNDDLNKLEKYENGAYERGVRDGQAVAIRNSKEATDEAYQRGLSDAWATAWKTTDMTLDELKECFGSETDPDQWLYYKSLTAAEAIEKIRAYEEGGCNDQNKNKCRRKV